MKNIITIVALVLLCVTVKCEDEKQIKLEDIEHDTLLHETGRSDDANAQKELAPQSTQHIQLSYGNNPQDVFVTPSPGHSRYAVKVDSPADLREQVYHLPKVHEGEQTYTAPAKASLLQPVIGGGQPIQPTMVPQPQYIYIPSPPQAHHPYVSQAHAYVMVPFVSSPPPPPQAPPTVFTYSHAAPTNPPPPPPIQHQPSYQAVKSIEYAIPSTPITPLQTAVDYKSIATIVPKHTLPSLQSSFRQYYSPGLEYHYTEVVPTTKLNPSYAYHHAPTHSYQTSYVSQPSPYYYPTQQNTHFTNIFKQPAGLLNSYVPNLVSYRQQQQPQQQYQQTLYKQTMPQQLFTPAQQHYAQYPTHQEYNTIAYSIPYEHTKRSTKSATTATLNVKAPKSS
ncbi:hypothetical protein PVAND_010268 [Polypedilum vanderplanki]|uniref:Uncharacterized protein n=1 Tax=Polypedilum vanderplanki TaxID=319348 RepID=A0A9J6CGR4_POLVA|nr:hypothetical protein PVAND_010268 [Polypedilum vanderplanki]